MSNIRNREFMLVRVRQSPLASLLFSERTVKTWRISDFIKDFPLVGIKQKREERSDDFYVQ